MEGQENETAKAQELADTQDNREASPDEDEKQGEPGASEAQRQQEENQS